MNIVPGMTASIADLTAEQNAALATVDFAARDALHRQASNNSRTEVITAAQVPAFKLAQAASQPIVLTSNQISVLSPVQFGALSASCVAAIEAANIGC